MFRWLIMMKMRRGGWWLQKLKRMVAFCQRLSLDTTDIELHQLHTVQATLTNELCPSYINA